VKNLSKINSDYNVGSSKWHKDIAEQLKELAKQTKDEEEKNHFLDLAKIHAGISDNIKLLP
jgi:hypothetical protein